MVSAFYIQEVWLLTATLHCKLQTHSQMTFNSQRLKSHSNKLQGKIAAAAAA